MAITRDLPEMPADEKKRLAIARKAKIATEKARRGGDVLRLREAGMTLTEAGQQLGFSGERARAYEAHALALIVADTRDRAKLVAMEVSRYDTMTRAIWPAVLDGDLGAIDRALRISHARRTMLGYDEPAKIRVEQFTSEALDRAIEERKRMKLELLQGGGA